MDSEPPFDEVLEEFSGADVFLLVFADLVVFLIVVISHKVSFVTYIRGNNMCSEVGEFNSFLRFGRDRTVKSFLHLRQLNRET